MADIDIDAVERLLEGAAKASMAEKDTKSAPAPAAVAGPALAPASSVTKTEEKKDEKDDKKDRENGHSRSRDRDREERDRDRRHRSRSRSPHRDRRDRDRDYDRSRDRRRSGDKDYDRRDHRDRDYDRRDRDRSRRDDRGGDRDRSDRDHRRDDRSRGDAPKPKEVVDRPHIIGDSPPRRKEEPKGPSIENDDRDERTVFVQNMPSKATDKEIKEFFAQAGKVTEIRMITDKYSGKSKGFGYIEFESKQSIELALLLSGATVRGQPVIVQQSQAEKNRAAAQAAATAAAAAKDERRDKPVKIYVGNLPENTTEELLRKAFAKFGEIDSIQFHTEDDGRCKGYSFLTFRKPEDAKRCMKTGGVQILGKEVEIAGSHDAPVTAHKPANQGMFGELDDEGGGLTLNAKARVSLMKRLQRDEPVPPKPAAPVPTPCVMLSNMFDPAEETNPNFHLEIQEDVQGECARFGQVMHIFVDPHSKGFVYVKFATAEAAAAAFNALKGRFFSGRMIAAEFMEPRAYTAKFPGN